MATTTFLESGSDATQDLSFYSSSTGTVATATDQKNTGPRSIKLSTGSPAASATLITPLTGPLADSGSQVSYYFRIDVLPTAGINLLNLVTSGNAIVYNLQIKTDGTLINQPQGATGVTGTKVIAVNTWYRFCVSYYITNTTTFQFKVYVDGVLDTTANAGTLTRTGTSGARFVLGNQAGTNHNEWIDDIYFATGGASSASQPDTGNILVTAKRPNANGTTNGYTTQIGSGGSGYGTGHSPQVNEQPLSVTNGWSMVGNGSAVTEEYNIENASTGDVNISGLTIVDYIGWVYSSSLASETGQIIVNGSSSNISLTSTNTMFTKAAGSTTYPAGTGTDIGEITSTALTTVSLYECGIVIAYNPASGTPNIPYNGKQFFQLTGVGI